MKKPLYVKAIVAGLFVLFIGASVIPVAFGAAPTENNTPVFAERNFLLIPDSTAKSVGMYSPYNGTYLGDLIVDTVRFSTPINAVRGPDGNIYVSDQVADSVFVYDPAGNYLYTYADATDGLDNIRGIDFRGTELFISNGGTSGGAVKCIARFAGPHNRLPNFIEDGIDPFDILFLPDGRCLVADILGTTDNIRLYSANGTLQQILFYVNFPEQISFDSLLPGAFLTAAFSANVVQDFELNGTIVQSTPYSSGRGVFRLGNGNLLVTSSAGIQEIQPGTGTLIQTKKTGSGRFIEIVSTGPNQPPNTPSDPNPQNGATNVAINAALSWTGGDPNPGDFVTYDVYFGTTSPPPKVVSNQSIPSYSPAGMIFNQQYYWKIVAWDTGGLTAEGPLWSFTTQINNPPFLPSNPNPANGAIDVALNTVLSWTGGDPDPGDFASYDVYFGTTSPPPKVVSNQSILTYTPADMGFNEHYYWKIVSWDTGGLSAEGPLWDFFTITDTEPPISTHLLMGTMGDNNWYISCVTVTLSATDDVSGVDVLYYKVDAGAWTVYTTPFEVCLDGQHTLQYYAVDIAGNEEEPKSVDFKIDKTAPEITLDGEAQNPLKTKWIFQATVNDPASGVTKVEFYVDDEFIGEVTAAPWTIEYQGKGKVAQAIAFDAAGNSALSNLFNSLSYTKVNNQGTTTSPLVQVLLRQL